MKTLLDQLKELIDIKEIKECYFIPNNKDYSVSLDTKKTMQLLDEISFPTNIKIIDLIIEVNDYIITCNPDYHFENNENYFRRKRFRPKPELFVVPDTLLKKYNHKIGNEILELPIRPEE